MQFKLGYLISQKSHQKNDGFYKILNEEVF